MKIGRRLETCPTTSAGTSACATRLIGGHDPISFSLPPIVLALVGLMASLLPMLRAAHIDPARSLREG